MGIEIERKFLVVGESWRAQAYRTVPMDQGYLSGEDGRSSVRVRTQGDEARLNIKASVIGATRAEFDYGIPMADAREILETLCIGRLIKQRHYIEHQGHTWEVDEFLGANQGLVVAELELDAVDAPFERPAWLGIEVTDDRRYYNHFLALHPYSTWKTA